jgi:hypothetical protein
MNAHLPHPHLTPFDWAATVVSLALEATAAVWWIRHHWLDADIDPRVRARR